MRARSAVTLFLICVVCLAVLALPGLTGMGFAAVSRAEPPVVTPQLTPKPVRPPAGSSLQVKQEPLAGGPVFGNVVFSNDQETDSGRLLSAGHKYPAGITYICAAVPYRGVGTETAYRYEWYRDGLLYRQGEGTVRPGSGQIVEYVYGPGGTSLNPGVYEFLLDVGGRRVRSLPCVVEVQEPGPEVGMRCGPLHFRRGFSESSTRLMLSGSRFAPGTGEILALWTCRNVPRGTPYRATWSRQGQVLARLEGVFEDTVSGLFFPLTGEGGAALGPGVYRMVFEADRQIVLAGECTVGELLSPGAVPHFGLPTFSMDIDRENRRPVKPGQVFVHNPTDLYVSWPYQGAPVGASVRVTWYYGSGVFSVYEGVLDAAGGIHWAGASRADRGPLAAGIYRAVIEVDGQVVTVGACAVSAAGPPAPQKFGPLAVASVLDEGTEQPRDPGVLFHYGLTRLHAHWSYRDVHPGTSYQYTWYYNGETFYEGQGSFESAQGTLWQDIHYRDDMPLDPGPYEVVIRYGGVTVLSKHVVIEDTDGDVYGPVVFGSAFDEEALEPLDRGHRFDYGVTVLYAYWAFRNAPQDRAFSFAWYRDGILLTEGEGSFGSPSGRAWQTIFNDDGTPLEPGIYTINVVVDGAVVVADQAVIE